MTGAVTGARNRTIFRVNASRSRIKTRNMLEFITVKVFKGFHDKNIAHYPIHACVMHRRCAELRHARSKRRRVLQNSSCAGGGLPYSELMDPQGYVHDQQLLPRVRHNPQRRNILAGARMSQFCTAVFVCFETA